MQLRQRKPKSTVPTPTLVALPPSGDNAYTKATTPSKVSLSDKDLEKTLTEALLSYVNSDVKKAFDPELQNQLTTYLLQSGDPNFDFSNSPKTDKRVSVLDIVQREIDRFYDDFNKDCRVIVRLDGSAGRMTAMAELLWRLVGHPVPKQVCVDIDKETVELHRKNPLVDEAVHSDVYKYLVSNQFEETLSGFDIKPQTDSKKISLYLDFCRLPEGFKEEKSYPRRYDYNIRKIRPVMQKYPKATFMLSYSMRRGGASPEKKNIKVWTDKLYNSGIELQKVKTCKENKFRTEYLTLQGRLRLFASKRKITSPQAVSDYKSPQSTGLSPLIEQLQFDEHAERPRKKPRTPN